MCNWGYAFGLIPGAIVSGVQANKANKRGDSEMARSQALKDALNKKTKELQNTLETGEPVRDAGRVLNPDNKKKQTIKSLNIPLNSETTGTGLNI